GFRSSSRDLLPNRPQGVIVRPQGAATATITADLDHSKPAPQSVNSTNAIIGGTFSPRRPSSMKLVRFSTNGQTPRLGVLQGDRIADLPASLAASLTQRGVSRAAELAAAIVPNSTRAFLEGGSLAEEAVAGIKEWVTVPASSARLHAPITDPGKFICIGLNYRDHAEEANQPIPKEPPIFAKWSNAILDPNEPILRPRGSNQLDWEVELGVVIGKTARFVGRDRALDYVWGYTIINDVSARDFQFIGSQWMAGKIPETFAPV